MSKKYSVLTAFCLAFVLCLTGCGNANPPAESSNEEKSQEVSVEKKEGASQAEGLGHGMNGDVHVAVSFDGEKITEVAVKDDNTETKGIGQIAIRDLPEKIVDAQSVKVDGISGATYTSNAIKMGVLDAAQKAGLDKELFNKEVEKGEKKTDTLDTDVVVIGAGGAGYAAAVTAKEAGAEVVILEKLGLVGGNTQISGGEFAAAGNPLQKKENIEDSAEIMAQDMLKNGGDPILVGKVTANAAEAAQWLADDIGVQWKDQLMFFGGHSVKRSLIPEGHSGLHIIEKYEKKADDLGIKVLVNQDVKELLVEEGKVVGVKAENPDGELTVHAKAVILATGGFGANDEMCKKYDPEVDEKVLSTNMIGAQGEGIAMAEKVNAGTVDMDKIQLYPVCDPQTGRLMYIGDTRLVGGALLVNKEGKRFVEELATRREISMAIKAQTDSCGYLIWDEDSSKETGTIDSYPDEAKSEFDRGILVKADSLEELAKHFEMDPEALKATVENFNKNSAEGKDPEFNLRNVDSKWQVKTPPFYMLKCVPAVHHTMGGLTINPDAQVLDKAGKPIAGLYAAGEVTGGIHGSNRLGSCAMADIAVFGRTAGENAAKEAKAAK